jgi:hypothetical protein
MAEILAPLWSNDGDNDNFREIQTQLETELLYKASMISRSRSLGQRRSVEISLLSNESRAAEVVPRIFEISQDLSKIESSRRVERVKGVEGRLSAREPANPKLVTTEGFG